MVDPQWSFSGISTFAHLEHIKCLSARDVPFDIGVIGAPFDTAVSYRPGKTGVAFNPYRAAISRDLMLLAFLALSNSNFRLFHQDVSNVHAVVQALDSDLGQSELRLHDRLHFEASIRDGG